MIKKLFKALLDKRVWNTYAYKITEDLFPDELKPLYRTLEYMQEKYEDEFSIAELREVHVSLNPSMTSSSKLVLDEVIKSLVEEEVDFNEVIVKDIINSTWKQELCRQIMQQACDIADGKSDDWTSIVEIAEQSTSDFTEKKEYDAVTLADMFHVFEDSIDNTRWDFNLQNLQDATDGLPRTSFGIVAARPEVGKTAFWVSLCCAEGGFIEQGAKVHVWRNEESYSMVGRRVVSAILGVPQIEAPLLINRFKEKVGTLDGEITVLKDDVTAGADLSHLEEYLINNMGDVDILIVDQIDNITINGKAATDDHEALGKLYARMRMLANKYSVAIIAMTQAGAGADGKLYYGYNELYGSKTNKAAMGDYVFCIGALRAQETDKDTGGRAINFAKNKLKGPHGPIRYVLNHAQSKMSM